jgi:hypothetical protein
MGGVLLMGMAWGHKYELPNDVKNYLAIFNDYGIAPYLMLWVGQCDTNEINVMEQAWNAGAPYWQGILFDSEAPWKRTVHTIGVAEATLRLTDVLRLARQLSPEFVADVPYGSVHSAILPNVWNDHVDAHLPQVYTSSETIADINAGRYKRFQNLAATEAAYQRHDWGSTGPKPLIPMTNVWGNSAYPADVDAFSRAAFTRHGAASYWRYMDKMRTDVKQLFATYPREPGPIIGQPSPGPSDNPPVSDPWSEPWNNPVAIQATSFNNGLGSGLAVGIGLAILVGGAVAGLILLTRKQKGKLPVLDVLRPEQAMSG